jgi:LSD1 subclass zinc finger protein
MADETSLRPLCCSRCGAPVPLGGAALARCAHCGADTLIPPEYDQLQRAAQSFARDTRLAEELYGKVGVPPRAWEKLILRGVAGARGPLTGVGVLLAGIVVNFPPLGIPMMLAAIWVLGYPVSWVMRGAYWITGRPHGGPLDALGVLMVTMFLFVPPIGVWIIRKQRDASLDEVRRDIHASLAASMPVRPGGPSGCRRCGAPLDVPTGALGVPCTYCKTDNLVALPPAWVAHVRASDFHRFLRIDDALTAFRAASESARSRTWTLAFVWVLVIPAVLLAGWLLGKARIQY